MYFALSGRQGGRGGRNRGLLLFTGVHCISFSVVVN